jgi:two-component system, OmpR family, sensor kinase
MSGRPIGDEVLVRRAARDVAVQVAALVAVAMLLLIALVTIVVVRGQAGAADDLSSFPNWPRCATGPTGRYG